jgi:cyclase
MLKKRVIFTLLYANGNFMLSRNFRLQKVGDLRWLQKNYNFSQTAFSIDELIILDVSREQRDLDKFGQHVSRIAEECFVPIAVGGGVRNVEQARELLQNGADKIVINTLIDTDPDMVKELAAEFGRQCVVGAVDVKQSAESFDVWTENGTKQQQLQLSKWIDRITNLPIGEVYLNSMDRDGTGQGYLLEMLDQLPKLMPIPLILAGGAGKHQHLSEALIDSRVDAVATANLFNFVGDGLMKSRNAMIETGLDLAQWDVDAAKDLKRLLEK